MADRNLQNLPTAMDCLRNPSLLPSETSAAWFVLQRIRKCVAANDVQELTPGTVDSFLMAIRQEFRFALLVDLIPKWAALGADESLLRTLKEVTGL